MREWLAFNVNDKVRVKLTDYGRTILREEWDKLRADFPNVSPWRPPDEDADGWSEWQLWSLMQDFGPHMYMGAPKYPFATEMQFGVTLPDSPPI